MERQAPLRKFGICCSKAPPYLCAFTKIRFYAVSKAFLFKKVLHFPVKSGMLYPNGTPWIQASYPTCISGPLAPAFRPECCYFLHLPSYHLPCLPARAKAAAQPARAAVFLFIRRRILGILHEKPVVPLGKMSFQCLAPRPQSVYNTDSAGHLPAAVRPGRADAGRPAGRGHPGPLIAKRSTE